MTGKNLIEESVAHYASRVGDPYEAVYARLYAYDASFKEKFVLDTDEGLRRNMMQTTLEIITTYLTDIYAAENQVVGARLSHRGYDIGESFDVFFEITRDVIAAGCGEFWTPAHTEAWNTMLAVFKKARLE